MCNKSPNTGKLSVGYSLLCKFYKRKKKLEDIFPQIEIKKSELLIKHCIQISHEYENKIKKCYSAFIRFSSGENSRHFKQEESCCLAQWHHHETEERCESLE